MAARDLDATFFVNETPDIEFDDGLFRVGYNVGKRARFEIIMRPSVFAKAMLLASEAQAKWKCAAVPRSGNVTNIRR